MSMRAILLTSLSVIVFAAGMMGERRSANAAFSQTNSATPKPKIVKTKKALSVPAKDLAEAKEALAALLARTTKDCGSYTFLRTAWGGGASRIYAYHQSK